MSIKNATARWTMPVARNPMQNGTKKLHKVAPEDDELNEWRPPALNNLNVDFPKGKLIGMCTRTRNKFF